MTNSLIRALFDQHNSIRGIRMKREVKGSAIIDTDRCKGCGLCTVSCPSGIIELSTTSLNSSGYHPATITDMDVCIGCGNCFQMCPDFAIIVKQYVLEGE